MLVVKNPPANAGDIRDVGSIPGLGRSHGGGHGNPLQYSCLENPHGERSLAGYSPWGWQWARHNWMTKHNTHVCIISLNKMPWEEGNFRTGKANISSKTNSFCFIYFPRVLTCCFKFYLFQILIWLSQLQESHPETTLQWRKGNIPLFVFLTSEESFWNCLNISLARICHMITTWSINYHGTLRH